MRYRVAHRRAATQSGLTQVLDAQNSTKRLNLSKDESLGLWTLDFELLA